MRFGWATPAAIKSTSPHWLIGAASGWEMLILFSDISEQKRAQKQLQDHQRRLASLEEREWLARELHDGVGQVLAAAHLQVKTASEFLARGQVAGAKTCLNQLAEVIQEGKDYVREYLFGVKTWSSSGTVFHGPAPVHPEL